MTHDAHVTETLQRGWWEDVLLVVVNGEHRVRKHLHRLDAPWARDVFIKEWRFLRALPSDLVPPFVRILDQSDLLLQDPIPPGEELWFDMEHLDAFTDVRHLLRTGGLTQDDADRIQARLIEALVEGLYRLPGRPFDSDAIIWTVMQQVLDFAHADADLAPFAQADTLVINGQTLPNLSRTLPAARADDRVRASLDDAPSVMLHGDLFYENILYRREPAAIRIVDPVSVAGVSFGPVVFDRVKFASWLDGELYALRHGAFELDADADGPVPVVRYAWSKHDPVLRGLSDLDLGSRVLAAMDALTGPTNAAHAVLDAYFALAMAANTPMPQRLLRYVRAVERLAMWG